MSKTSNDWDLVVKPKATIFQLNLKEVWAYKDLIWLLIKRDITSVYKQTILGPLWMIIQPIFTTAIYTFTFSMSAKLSTDGLPPVLFYLLGQTFWNYFSDCLNKTSNTFIANAAVFGKVYFPRLVVPISVMFSNLIKLALQFALFIIVYIYYYTTLGNIHLQPAAFLILPFGVLLLGMFSLSVGMIFSSFTTKYRDLIFLLGFAVQLLMFASCVVFPVSMYSLKAQSILMLNPIVTIMEAIKYMLTGAGVFSLFYLMVNTLTIIIFFLLAIVMFNRTEKSFMDTV